MARRGNPADRPDAFVWIGDSGRWETFCTLCPRALPGSRGTRYEAADRACEHLHYTHGLRRVWVDRNTPAHLQAVQAALPLVVAHDRTLSTDRWQG